MISLQYYDFPILCIIFFAMLCKQFNLGRFSCVLLGLKSVHDTFTIHIENNQADTKKIISLFYAR